MKTKKFPILYQRSSKDKLKHWEIWCEDGVIKELHGFEDGILTPETIEVKAKNIGKSNETSLFEQACSQAQSKWNKKIDKGYSLDGKTKTNVIYPMLAQNFKTSKHRLVYPLYTQPKLNGVRCVHDKEYQSRNGKIWNTLGHLDHDVGIIQKAIGTPLDGEIYIHGLSLQDIGALVKKERLTEEEAIEGYLTKDLEYWIYDTVDTTINYTARHTLIHDAFIENGANGFKLGKVTFYRYGHLVYVATYSVLTEEELLDYKHKFIEAEFEGGMARNDVPYVMCPGDHHCSDLQKLKEKIDGEFEIVGGKEGTGRDKGTIVFRCKTKEGIEFEVRPKGTVAQRKQYFIDLDKLVGKMLTCELQEWTKDMVPFHARGICVRDYE